MIIITKIAQTPLIVKIFCVAMLNMHVKTPGFKI